MRACPTWATCSYEGTIKEILHYYKYDGIQRLAPILARVMYHHSVVPEADVITSVPLHSDKMLRRGFNQAQLLAQELAAIKKVPYLELLQKNNAHTTQAHTPSKELRQKNMIGLYTATATCSQVAHNARVLIIDDVCTTGATLQACANALKKRGICTTQGLVLAHGA